MLKSIDKFYEEGHTFNFYLNRLKKLGCPDDMIELAKEYIKDSYNEHISQKNPLTGEHQSYIVRSTDTSFYYYVQEGKDFFQRIEINILIGYIDYGYIFN
jgi:hypothetical protein